MLIINKATTTFYTTTVLLSIVVLSVACTVGPDFESPDPPDVDRYTEFPLPQKTTSAPGVHGGAAQRFNPGEEIPAKWWKLFHSPELNAIIEHGLRHNPDLRSASASLRASEEELRALTGETMYPTVGIDVFGGREQLSAFDSLEGSPGETLSDFPVQLLSMYNANVSVAYVLDVFAARVR